MEIKLDRKKDYITKSDHKEQIMKYLSWKIKPFALYHEIREISRIFNFSPEEIESILKELEDENKIFPLTAEGFDLTIVYCLGCSWSGSPKRLVRR